MPAPYSDNLYSADDSDFDEVPDDSLDAHLSPTDGYFQSSTSLSAGGIYPPQQQESHFHNSEDNVTDATTFPTSAAVPHVPNVLVQDPSLLQREQEEQGSSSSKKDREAKEETRRNTSFHHHHHNNDAAVEAQSRHYSSTHRRTSSSVSAVDDFYDDGASSTAAADSEATPSHTTYTSHSHSHSHSHSRSHSHSHVAQSSSSYTPYSPSTDAPLRTPQTHSRYSSNNPASLFRIPSEAPPAYTPSPTSPLSSSPTEFRNYQTFNTIAGTTNSNNINMGAPEEERRLLGRDPESMGDVPYDDHDDDDHDPRPSPSWRDRALIKFPWASRRTLKMMLLGALVFFTLTGFLSMLASTVVNSPSEKSPAKEPPQQYDPVTGLPIKDGSPAPSDPPKPAEPGQPVPWHPSSSCLQAEHRFEPKFFDLTFAADKSISVLQTVETNSPSRGYQPLVSGDLVVRRQQAGRPGPSIEFEVVSNDPALDVAVEWNSEQQLLIRTPQRVEWTESRRPCMTVRATVWVPEGASLRHMLLWATNLDVRVIDDLSINLADGLEIGTLSGDVHSPVQVPTTYRLNSRDILVKTISGDIIGSWPLYDSLKINSESGDIIANVAPQQVLDSRPRPAVLEVATISGDVTVKEPLAAAAESSKPDTVVPPRDYITTLDTKSGSIKAWVAFSSAAVAESISGDIAAEFLPVYNVSLLQAVAEPELHTKTKSGDTAVKILDPIWVEILGTEGAYEGEKPRANPDEPVDIPTNPLPIPDKIPRMPGVPFTPIGAGPWKRIPLPGGRHLDDAWRVVRRHPHGDAITVSSSQQERAAAIKDQPPMRHLKSSHGSVSGSMELKYPASWEGNVEAESISGKIDIRGKDVRIDSRTKWPKAVHAHKGQAWNCQVSLGSVSGDEILIIGEER